MIGYKFLKDRYNLHNLSETQRVIRRIRKVNKKRVKNIPQDIIEGYFGRYKDIIYGEGTEVTDDIGVLQSGIKVVQRAFAQKLVLRLENFPESYFRLQEEIMEDRGEVLPYYYSEEYKKQAQEKEKEILIGDQKDSLNKWVEYLALSTTDYPDWIKYWFLKGVIGIGKYDKGSKKFQKRTLSTVVPFVEINSEALGIISTLLEKHLNGERIENPVKNGQNRYAKEGQKVSDEEFQAIIESQDFGLYYAFAIEHLVFDASELYPITKGEWKKFDRGSDERLLTDSIQGYGTGWCTAGSGTAKVQLSAGDFYVYFSNTPLGESKIPRLAIRMNGTQIGEVRGVAKNQDLDEFISPVLEKKLKEFGHEGERYRKKIADMRKLKKLYINSQNNEPLSREDLRFLYEFDGKIQGFALFDRTPVRVEKILKGRNREEDLITIVVGENLTKEEKSKYVAYSKTSVDSDTKLLFGDYQIAPGDDFVLGGLHIDGDVTLESSGYNIEDAKKIVKIGNGGFMSQNLKAFRFLDSEIAQTLIDAGYSHQVNGSLKSFDNLSIEVGASLVTFRRHDKVFENIDRFQGSPIEKLRLFRGVNFFKTYFRKIEKYGKFDSKELYNLLIECKEYKLIAEFRQRFSHVSDTEIINILLENEEIYTLCKFLHKFTTCLDHNQLVFDILDRGSTYCVNIVSFLKNFSYLSSKISYILYEGCNRKQKSQFYNHLGSFTSIHPNVFQLTKSRTSTSKLVKNLDKFYGLTLDHAKILVKKGYKQRVKTCIDSFCEEDREYILKYVNNIRKGL